MNWLQKCGLMLLKCTGRKPAEPEKKEWPPEKIDFAGRYPQVLSACLSLAGYIALSPQKLALRYIAYIMEGENDAAWWQENHQYLTQAWFIWEFCRRHDWLLPIPALPAGKPPMILRPEKDDKGMMIHLQAERIPHCPQQGSILLEGPEDASIIWKELNKKGFSGKGGIYRRSIDFCAQPLMDRCAEIGAFLLDHGYRVQVEEAAIRQKILSRDYEREHTHWVLAAPQQDQLLLRYPYDGALNRYVRMAGGKWNGREMQLSIRQAEKIEELIQLYSFRCTQDARKRLDIWRQALENATIYRQRPWKERHATPPPEDMFLQLLKRDRPIPPDLQEHDE